MQAWHAPRQWTAIDFISDLHLCAGMPRTQAAFARHLELTTADAVCLLGDVFEVWVGDDAREQAFERSVVAQLLAASRRVELLFMPGNRDFLAGADLCSASGLRLLADPTCLHAWGRQWVLCHGDAQCVDDLAYQAFRRQVRDPAWQREFLQLPLPQRLDQARRMRAASLARRSMRVETVGDLDRGACRALLRQAGATTLIHGHTHRPARHDLGDGLERWVTSDWDLDCSAGARRAEVLRLRADGSLIRCAPAGDAAPGP